MALVFFFFNDTATTEIYTLSLHDALPISSSSRGPPLADPVGHCNRRRQAGAFSRFAPTQIGYLYGARGTAEHERGERSEEHTSELQSRQYLVCRLLLEK